MDFEFDDIVEDPKPKQSNKRGIVSYLNPKNWGVDDLSSEPDFNTAFKKAREKKIDEFVYGNERYNVKVHPLFDASDSPNFNSAFRKAYQAKEPQFKYKDKVYKTELISKESEEEYKNAKSFVAEFIKTAPFSLSPRDSSFRDPWKNKMPHQFKGKQDSDRQESMDQFRKRIYTSITEAKGDFGQDGYYQDSDYDKFKKMFIYMDPDNPEMGGTAVHELTHKAGLITHEPLRANKSKNDYLNDPSERAARHMSTLYFLNKQGHKFDKFGDTEYKILQDAEENLPYDIYQLMEVYGGKEEFIRQMNIPLGYKRIVDAANDKSSTQVNNVVDFSGLL